MHLWLWTGFILFVIAMVLVDLGVFHRTPRAVSATEASIWTVVWIVLSLSFNLFIFFLYENHWFSAGLQGSEVVSGHRAALEYFTGYLIEKSLSLDNIFVIALIFNYFKVPLAYQHRVLFWGVLGAVVMRGIMIAAGAALIARFSWIDYVFGLLLLGTAIKMLVASDETLEPEKSWTFRITTRFFKVTPTFDGPHFFTRVDGERMMTPLFLVLVLVESSDVIFAVDSVPAIFAVTRDPFIVFTSNIFAILGLRSLYFVLASLIQRFRYLRISLVFLLAFVGVKMLLGHHYPIPTIVSLAIIVAILLVGTVGSILIARRE